MFWSNLESEVDKPNFRENVSMDNDRKINILTERVRILEEENRILRDKIEMNGGSMSQTEDLIF